MNTKSAIIILALVLNIPLTTANATGFENVCNYFDLLQERLNRERLPRHKREQFISNLVEQNLKPDDPARQAWEVVIYSEDSVRYELYKTSAEETTKTDWNCKPMKELIETAGK